MSGREKILRLDSQPDSCVLYLFLTPDLLLPEEYRQMPRPKPDLAALRARIAALEKRPALAEDVVTGLAATNAARGGTAAELLAVPPGVLHEIFADEQRHGGSALGFALGLARTCIGGARQALIYLQLTGEAQELGLPYGVGLASFGIDPDRVIIGRIASLPELLWAMEEAIACRAVAGVIADITGHPRILDFTVSRRLSMRAASTGVSAFFLRYGRQREASAAKLRWRVSPAASAAAEFDPLSPGAPRFAVAIEKRRIGGTMQSTESRNLLLEWTENGFVSVDSSSRDVPPVRRAAPASRPVAAALGHRLSQAG